MTVAEKDRSDEAIEGLLWQFGCGAGSGSTLVGPPATSSLREVSIGDGEWAYVVVGLVDWGKKTLQTWVVELTTIFVSAAKR